MVVRSGSRKDADRATALFALDGKLYATFDQCEQGVVLADADVFAGMVGRTALANDDVAGENQLTTVAFYAKAFRFGVATVPDTAACFYVPCVSFLSVRPRCRRR